MRIALLAVLMLALSAIPAAAGSTGQISVRHGFSGRDYRDGSVAYMRLNDRAGRTVLQDRAVRSNTRISGTVRRGNYTIVSYQRVCDGDCGHLEPASDRCQAGVHVTAGKTTKVSVTTRPGKGCTISVR